MNTCDCFERIGVIINSKRSNEEMEDFFVQQVDNGVFEQLSVGDRGEFYYKKVNNVGTIQNCWHPADKWYKCKRCGCVWEHQYPDFPSLGYVRKYVEEQKKIKY